jgi:two-component sensor histidine kinase
MDQMDRTGPEKAGLLGTTPSGTALRAGAAYEGHSEAIGAARDFTTGFLEQVDDVRGPVVSPPVVVAAQLVVSELVTNACKYAPGPLLVDLEVTASTLQITVWDSEPIPPVPHGPEPERVGQHGLEIVLALCQDLDIRREPVGKRIKASLPLHREEPRMHLASSRHPPPD